jgi:hypothetical protein
MVRCHRTYQIWLIFQRLYKARFFLGKVCKPPICHGDVQIGNIVVGFDDSDMVDLPGLMLIDFGVSSNTGKDSSTDELCRPFGELSEICIDKSKTPVLGHEAMKEFVSMWRKDRFWVRDVDSGELNFLDLKKIGNLFGDTAEQGVNFLSANDEEEICNYVFDSIVDAGNKGDSSGNLRDNVRELLEE